MKSFISPGSQAVIQVIGNFDDLYALLVNSSSPELKPGAQTSCRCKPGANCGIAFILQRPTRLSLPDFI